MKILSSEHVVYTNCFCFCLFCFDIQNNLCTQRVLRLEFSCTELVIQWTICCHIVGLLMQKKELLKIIYVPVSNSSLMRYFFKWLKTQFITIYFIFQEDEKFLTELFNQLTDEDTDENRRKELVLFLKEFFSFSTTLQPQARESFFKTLNSLGVLQAMEVTLASENKVKRLLWWFYFLLSFN